MSTLPADIQNPMYDHNIWEEQAAAREAMGRQESLKAQTEQSGLNVETHWRIDRDLATRSLTASGGEVTERYDVEMRKEVAHRLRGDEYQPTEAPFEIGGSSQGLNGPGYIRFPCGGKWYTLNRPLANETLAGLAIDFGLVPTATIDHIEKILHFHFQRLYRKPPDEWTESEALWWDRLQSYIDLEAYEVDNPIEENRIGILVSVSADQAVVRWNTDGEMIYDTRHVPTTLLTAGEGWTVHAIIQRTSGGEQKWLSSWVETPLRSDEDVFAKDIASPTAVSLSPLPDADWPKIPRLWWRQLTTIIRKFLSRGSPLSP